MPTTKGRVFNREFKLSALKRYAAGESAATICGELQIRRSHLSKWCAHFGREGPAGIRPAGRPRKSHEAGALDAVARATYDKLGALEWMSASPTKKRGPTQIGLPSIGDESDLAVVLEHLMSKRVLERRRALVILASHRGTNPRVTCKLLTTKLFHLPPIRSCF